MINKNAGVRQQERVATVICHELAHQWFGNLVTMKWWNDLWLNESFATYLENRCVDKLYPKFAHMDTFVGNIVLSAFSLDGLKSSHPIEVPIYKASQVDEVFDAISYYKGCAVLRMFDEYIGFDNFIAGLRN